MKVEILAKIGLLAKGQVVDMEDARGKQYIAAGFARLASGAAVKEAPVEAEEPVEDAPEEAAEEPAEEEPKKSKGK